MIVAGMATMPTRAGTAPRAIASLLPQVDRMWLSLDGFDAVPDFAKHPKITYAFGADHGGLKAEGKFLGLALDDEAKIYVSADDDILYPPNYVRRLSQICRLVPGKTAVGVHGSVFLPPINSYTKDRIVHRARRRQRAPWRHVDVLATNGSLHFVDDMRFDPRIWTRRNQVDLNFLEESIAYDLRLVTVMRPKRWVMPLDELQADSIYTGLMKDDSVQTERIKSLLSRRATRSA